MPATSYHKKVLNFTHMLTGAALASRFEPTLGLPLAFISHFALDAIPHYDGLYPHRPYRVLPLVQLILDFMLGTFLLASLTRGDPSQSYLVVAALTAILPDIQVGLYLNYKFLTFLKPLVDWHIAIQKKPPTWVGVGTTVAISILAIFVLIS